MTKSWERMSPNEKFDYLRDEIERLKATLSGLIFDTRLARRMDEMGIRLKQVAEGLQDLRGNNGSSSRKNWASITSRADPGTVFIATH